MLIGCGNDSAPSFGPETAPTAAQQSAITTMQRTLTQIAAANIEGPAAGAAAIAFAFSAQALVTSTDETRSIPRMIAPPMPSPAGDCVVTTETSIAWQHCTDSSGYTTDGSISWGPGQVALELEVQPTSPSQGYALSYALLGSMMVSPSRIQGDMGFSIHVSQPGNTTSWTARSQIDVELEAGCISHGTLTVRASGSNVPDSAVQAIWVGCDVARVRNG
jgi:hypothetical protein